MTDKDKIRAEIERRLNDGLSMVPKNDYVKVRIHELNNLLAFIDSLQEEPEPQFKVGDTIRSKHWNTAVHKIISMDDKSYCLDNGGKVDLPSQQLWELVEEPVSEDLESAAIKYAQDKYLPVQTSQAFKAGAKWQKEQFEKDYTNLCKGIATSKGLAVTMAYDNGMADAREKMMAKAIDGIARPDDGEVWCDLKSFNFEDGDKVKVIVIKED